MLHRGPDDEGSASMPLAEGGGAAAVHLGFQRLSIIDTSIAGHQPMRDPVSGNCLVFNGEIYNFREVRADLRSLGHGFVGDSDTEVVLHALSQWGAEAMSQLQGMFAFAFFEASTQRVLLARDPLGIKPLYYHVRAGCVAFASEVRAILAGGVVDAAFLPEGVAGYLAFGSSQEPCTVYRGISMLPAGTHAWMSTAEVREGVITPSSYWHLPRAAASDAGSCRHPAEEVRRTLTQAVETHLVADVPVSVFLSSGMDSGIIASIAQRLAGPVNTFTVGFDLPGHQDEASGARETAHVIGSHHRDVVIRTSDVPDLFARWLQAMDQPSIDGFNSFVVASAVRDAGFKVALSGLGSDEVFGGYPNFRLVANVVRRARWLRCVPPAMRSAAIAVATMGRSARRAEIIRSLYSRDLEAREIARTVRRIWSDSMIGEALGLAAVPKGIASDSGLSVPVTDYERVCELVSEEELTGYLRNTLLRDTDVYSMARSLEVRVPFLDARVVELVRRMPAHAIFDRSKPGKQLLRAAFQGIVPDCVFQRPKKGFSLPMGSWMKGPLREHCENAIAYVEASGFMVKSYARSVWQMFLRSGNEGRWMRPMALVALGACMEGSFGKRDS